jgi:hypothetical protein
VYNPNSPYVPNSADSSVYNPNSANSVDSPAYHPNSANSVDSPAYHPDSPDYPPPSNTSPDYPPPSNTSPHYPPPSNTSPDYPPPSAGFNKGDFVHFRGDSLPSRIWSIKNIGDQFITIETQNTAGLDISDAVRVVTKLDIYSPGDFAYSNPDEPLYPAPEPAMVPSNENGIKIPQTNSAPAINIKIVNGNDLAGSSSTGQTQDDLTINDIMQDSPNVPSAVISTPTSSGESNDDSGKIDFSNGLVIKKV